MTHDFLSSLPGYFQSWAALTWLLLSSEGWIFLLLVVKTKLFISFMSNMPYNFRQYQDIMSLSNAWNTEGKVNTHSLILADPLSASGIQTNDLDAYIKFDFPYPSTVRCFSQSKPAADMIVALRWFHSCFVAIRSSHRNTKQPSSRTLTAQVSEK